MGKKVVKSLAILLQGPQTLQPKRKLNQRALQNPSPKEEGPSLSFTVCSHNAQAKQSFARRGSSGGLNHGVCEGKKNQKYCAHQAQIDVKTVLHGLTPHSLTDHEKQHRKQK